MKLNTIVVVYCAEYGNQLDRTNLGYSYTIEVAKNHIPERQNASSNVALLGINGQMWVTQRLEITWVMSFGSLLIFPSICTPARVDLGWLIAVTQPYNFVEYFDAFTWRGGRQLCDASDVAELKLTWN